MGLQLSAVGAENGEFGHMIGVQGKNMAIPEEALWYSTSHYYETAQKLP